MLYRYTNLVEFLDLIRNEKREVFVNNVIREDYEKVVRVISGEFVIGTLVCADYYHEDYKGEPYNHKIVEHEASKVMRLSDDRIDGIIDDIELPEGVNEFFGVAEVVEMTNIYSESGDKNEYISTEIIVCIDLSSD